MSEKLIPWILNGQDILTTGVTQQVVDPNGCQLTPASCLRDLEKDVNMLAEIAATGMQKWRDILFLDKRKIYERAKILALERQDELKEAHVEIGGPDWFVNFNVGTLIDFIDEYSAQLSASDGEIVKLNASKLAMVIKEPIGPVLSMSPWNAPVILCARSILAPLTAGCSVVIKLTEKCPRVAYLLVRLFLEAGVPGETIQLAHTTIEDTPKFVDLMLKNVFIKKINFTGSTNVGKIIAGVAAKYLKPCLLELGGKNSTIIEPDADLDEAIPKTIWASWAHQGQICMSTDSCYVHESIFENFKTKLQTVAEELAKEPQFNHKVRDSSIGSKVKTLIDDALTKGASLIFPDIIPDDESSTVILGDITDRMEISHTEIFGPVLTLSSYLDTKELIQKLNEGSYGMKVSLWSKDIMKALDYAKQIQVGGVHINLPTIHDESTLPHGGVNLSASGECKSSK
ncbi:uncharacterized protein KQ657_001811 [Scheffersomyces spartinae]|uniref:Aldehyde dehydrogenase domain-containing protein n=1 Tax=Scheffersomyces spartinae TaxID=45513 RepID=A0A9P7V715_9ASCO|nr:uncharacterized protein KQ657_001811 [Scheffersomyces spartinae]KAG7192412.1 hypothetical protein KQ657_001811 [Scheffersomyces spartinae]